FFTDASCLSLGPGSTTVQWAHSITVLVTGGAGYSRSHMVHALVDAGERGAVAQGASLVIGDVGAARGRVDRRAPDRRRYPFRRLGRRAGLRSRSARLLPQQYGELARADRERRQGARAPFHLLFDRRSLRQSRARACTQDDATVPTSPYGSSKLMTEIMLRDAGGAHGLRYVILRYFNVAGADPLSRIGQSSKRATHLIKVSLETALRLRPRVDVFGTGYPTPDGTCIRGYIH